MRWDEYKPLLQEKWSSLLDSQEANEEKNLQSFLEEHPCLIPGAFGVNFSSGHFPFPCAVIAQPALRGLGTKVPDFMWIASDSRTIYPIMIEIETPTKRWFTREGVPHSEFTQAHTQLASWKTWFDSPTNKQVFIEYYHIPLDLRDTRRIHPLYVLIYGRRREFEDTPALNLMRGNLQRQDETLMTYDRLTPDANAQNLMCVKLIEDHAGRRYRAMTVPPTLTLGPLGAGYRAVISDKEEAATRKILIGPERREFLVRRFPYWDAWARSNSGRYTFSLGGEE
ncbi:MAG TPA: Shedu immune nuclease family protein [Nitrospiraceae bacterium]|jgi:hypothetical protein|nr:Shedu immune nuclease family protein [Nitrospiraceae bacterium]